MEKFPIGTILKLAAAGLGAMYIVGEVEKYHGVGNWIHAMATDLGQGVGTTSSAAGTTVQQVVTGQGGSQASQAPAPATAGGAPYSPALVALVQANPNFVAQAHQWRSLRAQSNQDANDWAAFQLFEFQIHAPNPGPNPPPEWPNF